MPYVKQSQRDNLDPEIEELSHRIRLTCAQDGGTSDGMLNYAVTRLVLQVMLWPSRSYQQLERSIGVLECAKLELYRKAAAPYEDQKALDNGEVYP